MRSMILMLSLAGAAHAQMPTYQNPYSTGTWSGVSVSTYQATEIDNWVKGASGTALVNRTAIVISLPAGKMNCGFDNSVSTQTSSGNLGIEYDSGIQYTVPISQLQGYWCMMQAQAAAQQISVQQISPFRPGTRTIPGSP